MSYRFVPRKGHVLAHWHSDDPALEDIEDMFLANQGTNKPYHRVIVHGKPCQQSPDWIAKGHADEALKGEMTASYAMPTGQIGIALYGTNSQGQPPQNAVDFFNAFNTGDFDTDDPCQDGGCDACWLEILWVQWVNI